MNVRRAFGLASATTLLAGVTWVHAQQPPIFRSGVDILTVDVTVLDDRGTPIEDLTADRFEVKVNGAQRRVVWSEFVPHRAIPLDPSGPSESFSSNEHFETGRLVMVAVDQLHIRRVEGLAALRAASNFIDSLDRTDLVAAAPVDDGRAVEFTRDHAAVKRYLERLTGGASVIPSHFNIGLTEALAIGDGSRTQLDMVVRRECGQSLARYENPARMAAADGMRDPCPVQVEQEGRAFAQLARTEARLSIEALTRLIDRLGEIEGQKTLVLVSEGLVAEPRHFDLGALGAAALAARVTLYVLQLDTGLIDAADARVSPTLQADRSLRADGLARLAGSSRGALFTLVGSDPYPFRRILRELSGYYLVAFEATDAERSGRTHRIAVRADAPGAIVRARPVMHIPATLTAAATGSNIERLLRSPRLSTELPVRVAAYTFQDPGSSQLRVLVSAETDHAGYGREVTLGYLVVNDQAVIVASGAGATQSGRFTVPVTVPPGRYMVKVAAVDAGGRQGSVERRFNALLGGKGAVRVSDLMIADPAQGDGGLRPAAARAAGNSVVMYLEAYAPEDWSPTQDVRFELRGASASLPPLTAGAAFRPAGPGRWSASVEVPLHSVSPGAYLAAAQVSLEADPPHRITRSFVVAKK